jgi:parallel beta-helix repeat protein
MVSSISPQFNGDVNMKHSTITVIVLALVFLVAGTAMGTTRNVPGTYATIQAAITAASTGDTIIVAAGTYNEDVNVNKSIQLFGAGIDQSYIVGLKTGAAQTIFLGANNTTLSGFTITRAGNNITDWASNVKTSGVAFGQTLTGCLVQNCKVTGNRNGVYLNNTQGATIKNNVITFNRTGVQLVNNVSNCLVENNTITNNWTMGFVIYYLSNTPATTNFVARDNDVSGNWYSQIESKTSIANPSVSYNFQGNWWGSGTLNVTTTPAGEPGYASQIPVAYGGSAVSPGTNNGKLTGDLIGLVNYDPWTGKPTPVAIKSDSVNKSVEIPNTDVSMEFTALPPGTNATVTVQETPTIPAGIPDPPSTGGVVAPMYLKIDAPALTNGTFSVTVTLDVSGIADFSSTTKVMYYSVASSSWVGVNGTYDAIQHTYTFATDHFTQFAFVNPLNPLDLYLTMDNTDVSKNIFYPHAIAGTSYGTDDWTYSPIKDTIYVVPTGTQGIVAASFIIHYDATMASGSAAAGNLFAGGAFNTSTPATGQLLIQTANLSPGINVTPDGAKYLARIIFTIAKPGYNSIGIDDLDFRYFVAGPDTQASVYVTSHPGSIKFYLGDFANASTTLAGDGIIDFNDLVPLSLAYWGESDGSPAGYKAKFDVGPTNSSGAYFAMPTPDGKIEFEDLVIFAIGYGKSGAGQLPKQTAKPVTLALGSMQTTGGEVRVPIALSGTVSDVRALSMILNYSSTRLTFKGVEKAGEMNASHSFMISKTENGKLMIDGAVLGLENNGLSHAGVIAYAVFTGKGTVGIESAKARSSVNSAIEVKYDKGMMQSNAVPERYALAQNYPNPFNPATTIHYALAKAGHVEVVVYNMLGEVIATLVNSEQNAGYYDVTWNGQNDKHQTVASGIYLYRMRSGDFVDVQKMVFMK